MIVLSKSQRKILNITIYFYMKLQKQIILKVITLKPHLLFFNLLRKVQKIEIHIQKKSY